MRSRPRTPCENTAIDIPTVFGSGSPEAAEVASNPLQAFADFLGIGVHCAKDSARCAASAHARPDVLTDEPGGYNGFNGLFGAAYVNPIIKPTGLMTDLDGNVIQDATGHVGFPGFDVMEATVSLAWIAQMQEAGIPITYAYSRTHMMPTAFRAASTPPTVRARSATPSNCRRTIRPFRNSSTGSRPTELPDCGRGSRRRLSLPRSTTTFWRRQASTG